MSQKHSRLNILQDLLSVSYGHRNKVYLSNRATDNLSFTQRLTLVNRLDVHNGCVNTICWNDTGQYILSGSDDQQLVIVNPFTGKVETSFHSAHRANIFSAKFLPNSRDRQTVSCSADGLIYYCDFDRPELLGSNGFDCHLGAVYEVLTVPNDPYTFLSCGEDGTVRWFDLRTKTKCIKANCEDDIMINSRQAVMSLAINPMMPFQLAIGCADSSVRVYDRRQLATGITGADPSRASAMLHFFSAPSITRRSHRITSLVYSRDGEEILVSYSSEHLYLFNFRQKEGENHVPLVKSFKGSENVRSTSVPDEGSSASASATVSSTKDATSCGEYVFRSTNLKQPPVKRLRLRGDWSDTGPNARPERERDRTPQDENAASIMQRMSNMLTRLLEGRLGQDRNAPTTERPSSDGSASEDLLERPGFDVNESTEGADGEVPTAGSSLSNSDASSLTNFVSFSTSERDESGDDSKEAFEMSEDRSCSFEEDKAKSQEEESLQNSWATNDDQSKESTTARESLDKEIVNQQAGPLLFSGDQVPAGTVMMDGANDVVQAELTSSDNVEERGRVDLNLESADETRQLDSEMTSPLDSADHTLKEDNPSATGIAESALESIRENVDRTGRDQDSPETCRRNGVARGERLTNANLDLKDGNLRLGEKVKSLADCFADVLVTEQPSSGGQNAPPELRSNDPMIHQQKEGLVTGLPDADVVSSHASTGESPKSPTDSSSVMPNSKVSPANTGTLICRGDLNEQVLDGCEGKSEEPGPSSELHDDPPGTSDSELHEDDSDSEEAYSSQSCRQAWLKQRLEEKNAAASKLQAVFRQRLEQKTRNRDAGMSLPKPAMKQCYVGHRNSRTMIKEATFWGDRYIMSGSDCGHIFVWDRRSAELVMLMEGDRHVVNCLQPHPYDPILASSGIDYDVKIWMPANESPGFDQPRAAELMRRNEVMLEETRDTVTVPASFMLRMLLSLNHARRNSRGREGSGSQGSSESSRDD